MFKALINTIQHQILDAKLCIRCTRKLDNQKLREPINNNTDIVRCRCNRLYTYDRAHRKYHLYVE